MRFVALDSSLSGSVVSSSFYGLRLGIARGITNLQVMHPVLRFSEPLRAMFAWILTVFESEFSSSTRR